MKQRFKSYIFIIVISIIASIPLFCPNFNIYIDDGIQHVCRIMGSLQSITEGQTFPVIMSNFCNGFGYSWNLFYSPITAYVPLLFHFFTNSFVLDIKIFMLFVTIFSGISMYEFLNKVTKNKNIAILGAVIYILAPYRLNDMYIRMALAELTSFIFLPMVFHGLYNALYDDENSKSYIILIIGAVGLILSHLIITMYTAIISFIYIIINFKKLKNKKVLKKIAISIIFILCITSFYLLPMLEQKANAQYEVFKPARMERTEVMIYYKLDIIDLLYTKPNKMTFEIGFITLIAIILTPFVFKKIDKNYKKFYIFSMVIGLISVIMTLKIFPFENMPPILKMIQFSFRMLEFSSFFLAIVASINYGTIITNFKLKDVIVLSFIVILLSGCLIKCVEFKDVFDEKLLWPAVEVTEDTKRVHAGCASFEYLPSKAFEHLDYIKTRENKVYVLEGLADISREEKNGTSLHFDITCNEGKVLLELPYIYYSGYEVTLNNNEKLNVEESENGFLQVSINKPLKNDKITVKYTGTNIMKISIVISILSFSIMVLYYCIDKKINN